MPQEIAQEEESLFPRSMRLQNSGWAYHAPAAYHLQEGLQGRHFGFEMPCSEGRGFTLKLLMIAEISASDKPIVLQY